MHFVLDLLQGLGIAAAIGIRPFLPVLLAGALAAADTGLDFDGTGFAFLEQWWLWAIVLVIVVGVDVLMLRGRDGPNLARLEWFLAAVAVALGALEAAGSLEDRGNPWVVGLIAGAAAAAFALAATRPVLARVRRRLDREAAVALPWFAEVAALVAAGLSILLPWLALLVLAALAWLMAGGRRREGEKYAGLRILR